MASSILLPARCTQQPTQAPQIDWSNPITQGLAFAFVHGAAAMGYCVNGQNYLPYVGATPSPTPVGMGARSTSTSTRAYSIGNHGITSTNYSLFAVGTAGSGVTQSAIDADNSSPRYFQFRISANKVEFIPFNTSAAVTGQPVIANALTAAELARGFTMGATASPTRTAAFQNGQIATATPSNLIAMSGGTPISIGARSTGVTGWSTGALAMVAAWSRTLSDAEMLSLAANPWQIFKAPNRRLLVSLATTTDTNVSPAAGALALTGYAPTVAQSANRSAAPGAGALAFTGYAPTVTRTVTTSVQPLAGTLTFTGFAPTVARTANANVTPGAGSLTLTGYAPAVVRSASLVVSPAPAVLVLAGYAPLITQGADNAPRVNVATIMRITTTNSTASLQAAANVAARIRSTGPNLETIIDAGAVNRAADLGPATINRTVSFP
jgi:hypothetical protein